MKILKEFKEFAVKGNVIDLAVGVIIGGAFGAIVSSLVNDIIMPPISYLTKGIDFKNLKVILTRAANGQPSATLNYGNFIQNVVQFVIVALVIFLMVKTINAVKRKKQEQPVPPPPAPKEEIALLSEIRDLLKKR